MTVDMVCESPSVTTTVVVKSRVLGAAALPEAGRLLMGPHRVEVSYTADLGDDEWRVDVAVRDNTPPLPGLVP